MLSQKQKDELKAVVLVGLGIITLVSLLSYTADDVGLAASSVNNPAHNLAGRLGAYLAYFLYTGFGYSAYLAPLICLFWAFGVLFQRLNERFLPKIIGGVVILLAASATFSLIYLKSPNMRLQAGGIGGLLVSKTLYGYLGVIGAYIVIAIIVILSLLLASDFLILGMLAAGARNLSTAAKRIISFRPITIKQSVASRPRAQKDTRAKLFDEAEEAPSSERAPEPKPPRIKIAKAATAGKEANRKSTHQTVTASGGGSYTLPSLELLNDSSEDDVSESKQDLQTRAQVLESTLRDFGIEAKVVQIDRGPVVTRYELQPAAGVKVQRIVTLSDDIALAMKAISVRVVAPIPGKDRVGIEVPNSKTNIVKLKDIITSSEYRNSKSKLTLAIGKDIAGEPIISDLGVMPHLLIAGATGSGKTVCVNSIIISMLYRATPDEVKFIMVDPKMVELAPYNGLPHLLSPVITNHKKVSAALGWTVSEMENRYEIFAEAGARNIEIYNKQAPEEEKLPYIVLVIDELADLMVVASQDIENVITRLSQLSRAVGIHIILATQRPSVDVITGVIKANFPTRISFKVASKVDSRTVLDANGADKLLGRGDLLFVPPGSSKMVRAQAPLVTDEEIGRVVSFVKDQQEASYNEEILKKQDKASSAGIGFEEKDELFDEAVRVIAETKHASVSMLQRRLRLGYTRAARLIDAMEAEGIIGPYCGSKPREIIIDINEYLNSKEESE